MPNKLEEMEYTTLPEVPDKFKDPFRKAWVDLAKAHLSRLDEMRKTLLQQNHDPLTGSHCSP